MSFFTCWQGCLFKYLQTCIWLAVLSPNPLLLSCQWMRDAAPLWGRKWAASFPGTRISSIHSTTIIRSHWSMRQYALAWHYARQYLEWRFLQTQMKCRGRTNSNHCSFSAEMPLTSAPNHCKQVDITPTNISNSWRACRWLEWTILEGKFDWSLVSSIVFVWGASVIEQHPSKRIQPRMGRLFLLTSASSEFLLPSLHLRLTFLSEGPWQLAQTLPEPVSSCMNLQTHSYPGPTRKTE